MSLYSRIKQRAARSGKSLNEVIASILGRRTGRQNKKPANDKIEFTALGHRVLLVRTGEGGRTYVWVSVENRGALRWDTGEPISELRMMRAGIPLAIGRRVMDLLKRYYNASPERGNLLENRKESRENG